MKPAYIYQILGKSNGRCYVGSALDYRRRWAFHRFQLRAGKHSVRIQRAFDKHGEENFEYRVIETCTEQDRLEREAYWIEKFEAFSRGYNCIKDPSNPVFSVEALEYRSQKIRDAISRPGVLERRNAAIKAAHQRPEVLALHSRNSKRNWADPEYRSRMLKAMHSPEAKAKRYGPISPATREKMRIAKTEYCARPGERDRMSEKAKKFWSTHTLTPEQRALRSVQMKRRFSDPEERRRHGENTRRGQLYAKYIG